MPTKVPSLCDAIRERSPVGGASSVSTWRARLPVAVAVSVRCSARHHQRGRYVSSPAVIMADNRIFAVSPKPLPGASFSSR